MPDIQVIAQWVGIIFSIGLGTLNYKRDSIQINITLNLDMRPFGHAISYYSDPCGMIKITNIGRRAVFISHVYLEIPNQPVYLVNDSLKGKKLEEGDEPLTFPINKETLLEIGNEWDKIRAVVEIGKKKYYSPYISTKPSWINGQDKN